VRSGAAFFLFFPTRPHSLKRVKEEETTLLSFPTDPVIMKCTPLYHSAFPYCNRACNHVIELKGPSRLLSIKSYFAPCIKKERRGITSFYWTQVYVVISAEVHFTSDKWTVQSIYAIITGFSFFFNDYCDSASFVTCCMFINTADFLCQCIVHVLSIRLFFSLFVLLFCLCSLLGGIVWRVATSDRLTGLCTEPQITSPTPGGLLYPLLGGQLVLIRK